MQSKVKIGIFYQKGQTECIQVSNNTIISNHIIDLNGYSYIDYDDSFKKMISSKIQLNDYQKHLDKIKKYDKNIILRNFEDNYFKPINNSNLLNYMLDLSQKYTDYKLSIIDTQTTKYTLTEEHKVLLKCAQESFKILCLESTRYTVLKRRVIKKICNEHEIGKCALNSFEIRLLSAKPKLINISGKTDVIFIDKAAHAVYHEIFGHPLEVNKSLKFNIKQHIDSLSFPVSVLSKKCVSGTDASYDDEGNTIKEQSLIKEGKLIALMNDNRNREKFDLINSSNARRESFYHYPEPRIYNISVEKSNCHLEEILYEFRNGIIVSDVMEAYFNYNNSKVVVHAIASKKITNGKSKSCLYYLVIEDSLLNFYLGIKSLSNCISSSVIYCKSSSGAIYTESEGPDLLINKINITRGWEL